MKKVENVQTNQVESAEVNDDPEEKIYSRNGKNNNFDVNSDVVNSLTIHEATRSER